LPLVVDKLSSTEAWNSLNQAFCSSSHTRVLQLCMQLQNLKKKDSSISTYISSAKYLFDELVSACKILSPEEFNAIIFNNLRSSFHAIVAAISTRSTPVLFPELHSLLNSEEIQINATTPSIDLPFASMVQRNSKQNFSPSSSQNRPQNDDNNRPQNNNNNRQSNNNPNNGNVKCQICKQTGHLAYMCKYRYHGAPTANTTTCTSSNPAN
ncbi:UBN2 domain-containing protein, partial [Cephalotus follicularis]